MRGPVAPRSLRSSLAEVGPKLRARTDGGRQAEVTLAVQVLNRVIREAKPVTIRRR
jgi:hypothetical protein